MQGRKGDELGSRFIFLVNDLNISIIEGLGVLLVLKVVNKVLILLPMGGESCTIGISIRNELRMVSSILRLCKKDLLCWNGGC